MTMLATAFLGGLLAAAPQATTAQSAWPHWLGPTRDGRAASTAIPESGPVRLKEAWRRPIGVGTSGLSIAGGTLVTLDSDEKGAGAIALSTKDGSVLWRVPLDGGAATRLVSGTIPARSQLSIAGGRVVWSDCTGRSTIAALRPGGLVDLAHSDWGDNSPAGVPGRTRYYFVSDRTAHFTIFQADRARPGPVQPIDLGELSPSQLTMSADGRYFVFMDRRQGVVIALACLVAIIALLDPLDQRLLLLGSERGPREGKELGALAHLQCLGERELYRDAGTVATAAKRGQGPFPRRKEAAAKLAVIRRRLRVARGNLCPPGEERRAERRKQALTKGGRSDAIAQGRRSSRARRSGRAGDAMVPLLFKASGT